MSETRPLLAVLIDADNVPAKHAQAILKEVATIGEPALRRVYGDWSSSKLKPWAEQLPTLGLVARQETANTTGKNASDIGLVIDAMDILHSGKFDGFVIISSDSDFTALGNRLREDGLLVIGIGEKKTPQSLRNVCNRFIFIENLDQTTESKSRPVKDSLAIISEAIDKSSQTDEWVRLGQLGKTIMEIDREFDTRTYGHSKLSTLIKSLPQIEMEIKNGHHQVRLKN